MANFTKAEVEQARDFLANPPHLETHTSDTEGLNSHSKYLFEVLKSKIVLGEELTDAELLNAKQNLTRPAFKELDHFLRRDGNYSLFKHPRDGGEG
jgi:hypothetical protein